MGGWRFRTPTPCAIDARGERLTDFSVAHWSRAWWSRKTGRLSCVSVTLEVKLADLWVGAYATTRTYLNIARREHHVWLCPVPCLPIHLMYEHGCDAPRERVSSMAITSQTAG